MVKALSTSSAAERKLTLKQRKFIAHYLEHGNATEAALHAYDLDPDSENDRVTAATMGSENLRKLQIDDLMEEYGISDQKLLTKLDEGLDATRASNAAILVTKDGTVEKAEEQGLIEVPDYATRHKYLETALKLKKRLGPDTQTQSNTQNNYYNLNDDQLDQLIAAKLRETGTGDVAGGEAATDAGEPA